MSSWQPSAQQLAFFKDFGYLGFPGLLKDRIDEIIQGYDEVWQSHGGGHSGQPHDGKKRSCVVQFADQNVKLSSLLDDPRIDGLATALLGDDYNYMGSDGNYYAGDTGWHSDGWHPPERLNIKMAFYLDPLTRETGSLRVIPGSHRVGDGYAEELTRSIGKSQELWGIHGRDVPAVALETKPGDLVVFNHNTKHAAFGGGGWRRMFTLNLCQRYPQDKLQELRDYISHGARFWIDRTYADAIVRTATPGRMKHLEQVMANDGHLAELSRKARETMPEPSRG